jgi:Tol biopolymer transport system component
MGTARLEWRDRTGAVLSRIGGAERYLNSSRPALSPDGRRLAISRLPASVPDRVPAADRWSLARDIWAVDVVTGAASQITFGAKSGYADMDPAWSSDGRGIAYVSLRNGRHGIYTKRADGSANEELIFESSNEIRHLSWSPDGRFIVFDIDNPKTGLDIWALPTAPPRTPFPIVQTLNVEHMAQISPDGKWLAYLAFRRPDRGVDVYVRAFPDGQDEWSASAAAPCGAYPQWRGNSAELYFMSCGSGLMVTEIRADGASLPVASPRTLIPQQVFSEFRSTYTVSPDGRFLVLKEEPTR